MTAKPPRLPGLPERSMPLGQAWTHADEALSYGMQHPDYTHLCPICAEPLGTPTPRNQVVAIMEHTMLRGRELPDWYAFVHLRCKLRYYPHELGGYHRRSALEPEREPFRRGKTWPDPALSALNDR